MTHARREPAPAAASGPWNGNCSHSIIDTKTDIAVIESDVRTPRVGTRTALLVSVLTAGTTLPRDSAYFSREGGFVD